MKKQQPSALGRKVQEEYERDNSRLPPTCAPDAPSAEPVDDQSMYDRLMVLLNNLGFQVCAGCPNDPYVLVSGHGTQQSPEVFIHPDTGLQLNLSWVETQAQRIARDRELHLVPIRDSYINPQEAPSGHQDK